MFRGALREDVAHLKCAGQNLMIIILRHFKKSKTGATSPNAKAAETLNVKHNWTKCGEYVAMETVH